MIMKRLKTEVVSRDVDGGYAPICQLQCLSIYCDAHNLYLPTSLSEIGT